MNVLHRILIALFDLIRPFFGFIDLVCIYPLSCSDYAKQQICTQSLPKALLKIIIRVLSCNPLNAYFLSKKNNSPFHRKET